MLNFDKCTIKKVSEDMNVGSFRVGPLPRGYGYTVANALRRVMLSSLSGGAVTGIRILGVEHEYSTLPGVQDDMLAIIIKLKGLAVRAFNDEPIILKLEVTADKTAARDITAADIEPSADVEIVNPEYVITTLDKGASFSAELVIEKGVGFMVADSEKRGEINMLPVDGAFSPVINVEVKVTNARVGQRTDFDQIEMNIKTNGVVAPAEALTSSLTILSDVYSKLVTLSQGDMSGESELSTTPAAQATSEDNNVFVKNLKLSTRLKNALTNSAIVDLNVLDSKSREQLLEIRGMGEKSVDELINIMKSNGLVVLE